MTAKMFEEGALERESCLFEKKTLLLRLDGLKLWESKHCQGHLI